MTQETKDILLKAIKSYRGDDYQRALRAFSGLTPEEMQQPHGNSGVTRQEILDHYRQVEDACNRAETWLETQ